MPVDFSDTERSYFKSMFDMFDTDKSGEIGINELRNLAKHLGVEMSEDQMRQSIMHISPTAELDFRGFMQWLESAQATGSDEFAMLKAKITAQGSKCLTNEQIARLKEVFDNFDVDHSQSIDASELGLVFESMGQRPTEADMQGMIASVDADGSGEIEFNEFIQLMCGKFGGPSFETDVRNAFHEADPESTGLIAFDDLRALIVESTGGLINASEAEQIIRSISVEDKDGMVQYMKWEELWEAVRDVE